MVTPTGDAALLSPTRARGVTLSRVAMRMVTRAERRAVLALARVAAAAAEAGTRGARTATRGRAGLREAAPSYRRGAQCTGGGLLGAAGSWTKAVKFRKVPLQTASA